MQPQVVVSPAAGFGFKPVDMSVDDVERVRRIAAAGDTRAFEELFASFAPRVKALLLRQGCDMATAEEIAQEALLTVWRKAALFAADRGSVATWIFTIARNLRIDRFRRQTPWQEYNEELHQQADDAPLPDETLHSSRITERMRTVLAAIPQDQRTIIMLAYVDGLSHSEIAGRLDLPLGTVKSRMRLAYQKIRQSCQDLT